MTTVEAVLDLADFRDANNQPLTGSASCSFRTANTDPGAPPDVKGCYLFKARGHLQDGASPVASGLHGCDSNVELSAFNRVQEPLPLAIAANNTTGRLQPDEWDPGLSLETTYPDKATLDQFFPNGDFTFTLNTLKDGNRTVTLSLGASDDYPAAPTVTNLAALQALDPAADAHLSWSAPAGWNQNPATGGTFIEIEIENDQGNEVFHAGPGNGNLAANGCTVPADTRWPGRSYRVFLSFTKVKDIDTSYGTNGAGFRSVAEFGIKTAGRPVMPGLRLEPASGGNSSSTPYTIRVTAAVQSRSFGPHGWGDQPRRQFLEFATGGFGVEP